MANQNSDGAAGKTHSEVELQEHVRKATATTQAENATLKTRITELGKSHDQQSDTLTKVNAELATLRTAGRLSEDAEGFARYEADTRASLAEERRRLDRDYRVISVAGLVREFPTLTEAELTGFSTPYEMEIYALRNHARATDTPPPADSAKPLEDAPKGSDEPKVPQPDRGGAGGAAGNQTTSLRGQDKINAGLANMPDPLGVLPK